MDRYRMSWVLCIASVVALSLTLPPLARAAGDGSLRIEILVDGSPLPEYHARSTVYVEAYRAREYAIRLTNLEPVRVAVALSVDGRNTIDARRTSARTARKWVLEPYETVVIEGWQTGADRANRFFFTTEKKSYAAWLGDVANAGVIEAVAFRERVRPRPVPFWERGKAEESADGPAAPSILGGVAESRRQAPREEAKDSAATGFGRDVTNPVVQVPFEPEDRPFSSVRIRYEYRDALVRLGVLPPPHRYEDPLPRREQARGFTDGPWCPTPNDP